MNDKQFRVLLNRCERLLERYYDAGYYDADGIDVDTANAIAGALRKLIGVAEKQQETIERYERALEQIATWSPSLGGSFVNSVKAFQQTAIEALEGEE